MKRRWPAFPFSVDHAVQLLDRVALTLPLRSIERDIVISAELYLGGETQPGHTVERWWKVQVAA